MADTEPLSPTAPRPAGRTVFTQRWRDVAFLHWAVDPARVAPLLPAGTRPDVLDGATYVGLIPFRMQRIGLFGTPGIPYLGSFAETNVRLYSVDEQGRRGVVFRSLDAERLLPVLAARWAARLPYAWSRMRVERAGDRLTYSCRRRWPGPPGAHSRVTLQVGGRLARPDPLAHFLTARWGLHRAGRGGPAYWRNEHPEWPLHRAELVDLDDSLLPVAGLGDVPGPPDSVLFSPGVDVRFGPVVRPARAPGPGDRSPRGPRRPPAP
ncbi:YqjF family protein [Blastococcus sp. SYSU DS1024]